MGNATGVSAVGPTAGGLFSCTSAGAGLRRKPKSPRAAPVRQHRLRYPHEAATGSTMPYQLPPVTRNLLIANIAVYLLQMLLGDVLVLHFALWPWCPGQWAQTADGLVAIGFRPWQLV